MCTVTIVPIADSPAAFCLAASRDESHGRTAALAPQPHTFDGVNAVMPIDPNSNGTWVGVNEHGLALTLLNYNLPDPPTGRDRSRGDVIPLLLGAADVASVINRLGPIERERMMPFRLVACDGQSTLLWRSTEPPSQAEAASWAGEPLMFTSSGLGDHLVETPRRELFNAWFGDNPQAYTQEQLAFHRHRWPGREHLSVCMHREDARTVSYTTIVVNGERIEMSYHPDRPDLPAQTHRQSLTRRLVPR